MSHAKSDKSRTIFVADLKQASKDYQGVVISHYRNEAALTFQSAFRRRSKRKETKKEARIYPIENLSWPALAARRMYWQAKSERVRAMNRLTEPVVFDDDFNRTLLNAIKQNEYHLINYTHQNFTQCLFASLRAGHITMNQMMTAKLMYESLICFNKGKMPDNPHKQFSKFKMSDYRGPYQPAEEISYWGGTQQTQLQEVLHSPEGGQHHYYTIDLPHHQAIGFLYYCLDSNITHSHFYDIFWTYIIRLKIPASERKSIIDTLYDYKNTPAEEKQKLQQFILIHEPNLTNFLLGKYDERDKEQCLGLTFKEFNREWSSTRFMVNLYAVSSQIPMFCTAYLSGSLHPLLSFVLPTIETLNMLQAIVHSEEITMPVAVIGQETPRMIRAFDEIPSLKAGHSKTAAQQLLHAVYPQAAALDLPSRPVELTYPGIEKTHKPHGADCHDFLLSWHDVFHAWRNGSNYKALLRHLRTLHDEKLGFAPIQDAMSKILWQLSDVDFSSGSVYRKFPNTLVIAKSVFMHIVERAGYSMTPSDDNYLLVYDLCKSPEFWGKPFGIDPTKLDSSDLPAHMIETTTTLRLLQSQIQQMTTYISEHPHASVMQILLHDLLATPNAADKLLISLLDGADLKSMFYWSKDSGVFFKKEHRDVLEKLGIKPKLRDNSPDLIRLALKQLAATLFPDILIQVEMMEREWYALMLFILSLRTNKHKSLELELFIVDKRTMSVVVMSNDRLMSSMSETEVADLYFDKLSDHELNKALKTMGSVEIISLLTKKIMGRLDNDTFSATPGLIKYGEYCTSWPEHLIKYNSTRYNLFIKEITTPKNESHRAVATALAFLRMVQSAGYSKIPSDANYLLVYDLCKSPASWGKPLGIDPKTILSFVLPSNCKEENNTLTILRKQVHQMSTYISEHPHASVIQILLHDLLAKPSKADKLLISLLNDADFKRMFYWSKNSSVFFKKEHREALVKLGVEPIVRDNSPDLIRLALKHLAATLFPDILIQVEMIERQWYSLMVFIFYLRANEQKLLDLEPITIDEKSMSAVVKSNGRLMSSMSEATVAELYFDKLSEHELNKALNAKGITLIPLLTLKTIARLDKDALSANPDLFKHIEQHSHELSSCTKINQFRHTFFVQEITFSRHKNYEEDDEKAPTAPQRRMALIFQ